MQHLMKVNLAFFILAGLFLKAIAIPPSIADAFIFSAACAIFGYTNYLKEKRLSKLADQRVRLLKKEVADIQDYLSGLRMERGLRVPPHKTSNFTSHV